MNGLINGNETYDVLEIANDSLNMQRNYKYEDFLDNLRVGIHGRLPKVKGHIMDSILIKALQNQRYIPLFLLDLPT